MRKAPKVVFASISKNILEVFVVVVMLFLEVTNRVIFSINQHGDSHREPDRAGVVASAADGLHASEHDAVKFIPEGRLSRSAQRFLLWFNFCNEMLIFTIIFLLCQKYFRDLFSLRDVVENYDVRRAELGMEVDRPILLDFIDSLFRKTDVEDAREQGDAAQETLVAIEDEREEPLDHAIDQREANARFAVKEQAIGLRLFNEAVQKTVPQEIPVQGLKSWVAFGYLPAVFYGTADLLARYDLYSYRSTDPDWIGDLFHEYGMPVVEQPNTIRFSDFGQTMTTLLSLFMRVFVMGPMLVFCLGVEIRFFLWLQKTTKLPYWWSVAIFLPFFLFFERILCYRRNLFFNLNNLVALSCGSAVVVFNDIQSGKYNLWNLLGQYEAESRGYFSVPLESGRQYSLALPLNFRPFFGIFELLNAYVGYCEVDYVYWSEDNYRIGTEVEQRFDKAMADRSVQIYCRRSDDGGPRFAPGWENGAKNSWDGVQLWTINITYDWKFNWSPWVAVVVWFLVILPSICLLYYVYEPHNIKSLRTKLVKNMLSFSCAACWRSAKNKTKSAIAKSPKQEERSIFEHPPDTLGAQAAKRERQSFFEQHKAAKMMRDEDAVTSRRDPDLLPELPEETSDVSERSRDV